MNRLNYPKRKTILVNFTVSGAPTSSMACEDYTLNISCPDGYYLDIVNAFYGRKDENICYRKGKIINTNCSAQTALAVMHSR